MTEYDFIGSDAISGNAADFSKSLMSMCDYVEGSISAVIRKACIDLYRMIVERTPVDTGRAKASWGLSTTGAAPAQENKEGWSYNEVEEFVSENISEFTLSKHDDTVYIVNNLEYIELLESGNSEQAPHGMAAISLAEFEAHFSEHLKGLKGLVPA